MSGGSVVKAITSPFTNLFAPDVATPNIPSAAETQAQEDAAANAAKEDDRRRRMAQQQSGSLVNREFGRLGFSQKMGLS